MPVVRRRDDNCIDVFAFEDITVVTVRLHSFTGRFHCISQPVLIGIAYRRNIDLAPVAPSHHISKVVPTHPADTNMGHCQSLIRPAFALRCQHAGRNQVWKTQSCRARNSTCKEFTPVELIRSFHRSITFPL